MSQTAACARRHQTMQRCLCATRVFYYCYYYCYSRVTCMRMYMYRRTHSAGAFFSASTSSARQLEMRNTCTRDLFFAITLVAQIPTSRARNSFLFRWSQAASASYSPLRLRFIAAAEHMRQANAPTLKFAHKHG